ncbi:hypothetical protein K7I13_03300 [Brucepastera parasyntrophica]|uniref:hypothetical protein n=1 Tax=Brucepastera parasyntrophica TaxID=2880008 RepID=UPI00210D4326|nr:hypothetical protein [Brucepastera parasyntrophica]ULQ60348.1 hypothetical protein K7I13_03300 [Brucepastera parasyntrophica]
MRIALISFCPANDNKSKRIAENLVNSAQRQGHQAELISGLQDMEYMKITIYDYITVLIKPAGLFGGTVPPRVSEFFSSSGSVAGKKGAALVIKSGFSTEKTCRNLMRVMEKEGVKLDYFEVIKDADHAAYVGKKLG